MKEKMEWQVSALTSSSVSDSFVSLLSSLVSRAQFETKKKIALKKCQCGIVVSNDQPAYVLRLPRSKLSGSNQLAQLHTQEKRRSGGG